MQVCVQLPTSADSVALPAFAFARRAAAWLLLTAGSPAKRQSIDTSWPPGPQQQTRSSPCPSHGRAGVKTTLQSCCAKSAILTYVFNCLQCFDAVGWAAGRASGL